MQQASLHGNTHPGRPSRYGKAIENSKRIRWDIDKDVIRGRRFDFSKKFLPDGLTQVNQWGLFSAAEKRQLSQIQGRTYANMFGLVERFIAAKVLDISRDHWVGDQVALEALVRFTDEELKHQALFRRIEQLAAQDMPAGYFFCAHPDEVATAVLGKSTWAVLALTCHIELFTLAHYRSSIEPDAELSDLFKDVLLYHWKEESQHAILDELEWIREDAKLTPAERDAAVDDLISLAGAVDSILQVQAQADKDYFTRSCNRPLNNMEETQLQNGFLRAYRWQYIVSGVQEPQFVRILGNLANGEQRKRISAALEPIIQHVKAH